MRYLLDEDVNPATAVAARALGLDVVSVHEVDRCGPDFPDDSQLRFAAFERRIMVTRNRNDYIRLTLAFFQTAEPHYGILIVPYTLPNGHPGRIARALVRWHAVQEPAVDPEPYILDFLASENAAG